MEKAKVSLIPLETDDREQFILDNQWAFKYGAMIEFGERDNHFEEDGEIISRKTIEESIDAENSETYRIMYEGRKVGGVVLSIDKETHHNELDLFFINPDEHGKGLGYAAWRAIEALYPETKIWETITPYFEKRNIHFYVNKCGFHIVEFYNRYNPDPHMPLGECDDSGPDEMFCFQKIMKNTSEDKNE
ncbi:MAG: GNAT family N-acetyltransferase [Faecalibacterium prausnitzii]|nr:GNAT family N-acetyltransferase [Faecalibacterium prausnitzii]